MEWVPEDWLKLGLAVLFGGMIGFERESRDKAAGFRTVILISVGSTLFAIVSMKFAKMSGGDPTRIASGIIGGIGFLGAGTVIQDRGRIHGLTTAATIWAVAAIGLGLASGAYVISTIVALVVLIVLWLLPSVEGSIQAQSQTRRYEVTCKKNKDKIKAIEAQFKDLNLIVTDHTYNKEDDTMICIWQAIGRDGDHNMMMRKLFDDEDVMELNS